MSTIAAISTPQAVGGIAMIRISGEDALAVADRVFVAANHVKVTEMRGYSCAYGYIEHENVRVDDVVLTVFRAPHSYTGEDTVEITCHGGIYLTNEILHLVLLNGAAPAEPGEFTKRSFLNGKMSLSQAEAVMDVIEADGKAALNHANMVKDGRLSRQMREVTDSIIEILSALAYWMDDAEEFPPELDPVRLSAQILGISDRLSDMEAHYQDGKILKNGIRTVLLGRPNAGKSSVMNWLCGENRSIVTSIPGTTRDVVTESVKIGPYVLVLSDTAGIRETENEIESIGIEQAMRVLGTADLILYVVDSSIGMSAEDEQVLSSCENRHVLILWNKTDLETHLSPNLRYPVVQCAAIQEDSLIKIQTALEKMFPVVNVNQASVINERQFRVLHQANLHLTEAISLLDLGGELDMLVGELDQAARNLSEIDGIDVSQETIDGVFSRFCVGK